MTRIPAIAAAVAISLGVLAGAASGQSLINPFTRDSAALSEADLALMRKSMEDVLNANRAGASAAWKSRDGKTAGKSTLRKTFTKQGMPCGEVEHVFTAGEGHRYVLPFCKVASGQWKLAF